MFLILPNEQNPNTNKQLILAYVTLRNIGNNNNTKAVNRLDSGRIHAISTSELDKKNRVSVWVYIKLNKIRTCSQSQLKKPIRVPI